MLNSAPKQSNKYHQGLFTPVNKDKVIKLNSQGGLYYRSGLEQKMMIYLDNNSKIINWGAEHLRIPYTNSPSLDLSNNSPIWNLCFRYILKTNF